MHSDCPVCLGRSFFLDKLFYEISFICVKTRSSAGDITSALTDNQATQSKTFNRLENRLPVIVLKYLALMSRRPHLENETIPDLGWSAAQTKCRNRISVNFMGIIRLNIPIMAAINPHFLYTLAPQIPSSLCDCFQNLQS